MDYVLLVEGPDDRHVIRNLLKSRGLEPSEKQIRDMEGISNLLSALPAYLKSSERAIGVVVDADLNTSSRWQAVANRARDSGYRDVPQRPSATGTILFSEGRPRLGIWLMPNNEAPGTIEEFVQLLMPEGDDLWPLARNFVSEVPHNLRRFRTEDTPKAEIHTWLALQPEPGTRMGAAITKRYLDGSAVAAESFVAFVQRLAS